MLSRHCITFSSIASIVDARCISRYGAFIAPHVMTVRRGHYFSFTYPSPPSICRTTNTLPSLLVNALSWTYLLTPRQRQDALRTVRFPPPIYYTPYPHPFTVPLMRASVPADVHPSCPPYAHISSPLPYVSLHPPCTLLTLLTCVTPRPLYAFS